MNSPTTPPVAQQPRAAGVVLVSCLIILTLLALTSIGGSDRALVALKLSNNLKAKEQSFLLAEAALQQARIEINNNPLLLAPATVELLNYAAGSEGYSVLSSYRGSHNACEDTALGKTHHYELLAIAHAGNHAVARHAVGIALCTIDVTTASDEPVTAVIYGEAKQTYWRPVQADEAPIAAR